MSHIAGMTILRTLEDGSVVVKFSPAAMDMIGQIVDIATPVIKARIYQRELKRIERAAPARERLDQDMTEVKNKILEDLREPNAARLAAIKAGPPNWDIQ